MKVKLRIERLVLDGVELDRREREALVRAIQRELGGRLGGPRAPQVDGNGFPTGDPRTHVDRIGSEIATAVHRSIPPEGELR